MSANMNRKLMRRRAANKRSNVILSRASADRFTYRGIQIVPSFSTDDARSDEIMTAMRMAADELHDG